MTRVFLMLAAMLGTLGVGLGAFGAHGLKKWTEALPDGAKRLEWWSTAAQYQMIHALALMGVAILCAQTSPTTELRVSGWAFVLGTIFFSGSLYAMTLTGIRVLGAVTPIGGLCFLVGWIAIAVHAWGVR